MACETIGRYILNRATVLYDQKCKGFPNVFAKVSSYLGWIDEPDGPRVQLGN